MEIRGRRVLISGGTGFLGQHLVRRFSEAGALVFAPPKREYDLTSSDAVELLLKHHRPSIVVHAAGDLGGIHYNRLYPARVFYNNLLMTLNVLEIARKAGVEKLVNIGSACAYPGSLTGPFREENLLDGPMHPSVHYYGLSKRALYLGAMAYAEQYGLRSIHLVLANLYGPGDKFDAELSHVISALVAKFVRAVENGEPEVVCWGTGTTMREFLFVEDCAEAVLRATQAYDSTEPLNIGVGSGVAIRDLVELIRGITAFPGRVVWDTTKPDGAMYKVLDISRMRKALEWEPATSFREGLRKTVDWYVASADRTGKTN
jgi:GDP-L-fucose synthase